MSIISEECKLNIDGPYIQITYNSERLTAAGSLHKVNHVWVERSSRSWISTALRSAAADLNSAARVQRCGNDHLEVSISGHELEPYINLQNERPTGEAHDGYFWFSMSPSFAIRLARDLDNVSD